MPELTEKGVIEIAPLAYMRGRTLNNAFIILDEAQNTTTEQMMMFLTRLGDGSQIVVTGDITQIDLPRSKASGLVQARKFWPTYPASKYSISAPATLFVIRWSCGSSKHTIGTEIPISRAGRTPSTGSDPAASPATPLSMAILDLFRTRGESPVARRRRRKTEGGSTFFRFLEHNRLVALSSSS